MAKNKHLDRAIALMGGVTSAATRLGLKRYQTLQQWQKTRVPADRCPDIEIETDGRVTCEQLRPDLKKKWQYLRQSGLRKVAA